MVTCRNMLVEKKRVQDKECLGLTLGDKNVRHYWIHKQTLHDTFLQSSLEMRFNDVCSAVFIHLLHEKKESIPRSNFCRMSLQS